MRKPGQLAGRSAFVLLAVACGCYRISPADADRLAELERRHASQYQFSTADALYLRARARPGVEIDSVRAEQLYREFFFDGGRERRSDLVYLNLYDAAGSFLYQLAYDRATGRIVRGHTEYY